MPNLISNYTATASQCAPEPWAKTDLEEAILIRRVRRADDESGEIADVGVLTGDRNSCDSQNGSMIAGRACAYRDLFLAESA